MADLRADVILVEPPGGSRARALGPFFENRKDPNRSLQFWAFNRNKRAITLDPDKTDDHFRLKPLIAEADFLIESAEAGYFSSRGLGYRKLAELNRSLSTFPRTLRPLQRDPG